MFLPPETRVVVESMSVSCAGVSAVSTSIEYVQDEHTLVFHGVMTEPERDRILAVSTDTDFQRAIHCLFDDSRRFFKSWESPLAIPPTDLKLGEDPAIAAELYGRLQYCLDRRALVYFAVNGPMTKEDLKNFRAYSNDTNYQSALTQLHQTSRTFFNKGEKFIALFKWILILISAEVLKAIAIAVYENLKHPTAAAAPKLWSADFGWALLKSLGAPGSIPEMVGSDLVSFAKVVTTVLLLTRYFVCLVDPVWKSVGIYPGRAFVDGSWRERLSSVGLGTLCGVAALSIVEFLILYHAAKAVTSVRLWLQCLWLLVVVDSIAFFVLPLIFAFCALAFHKWIRRPYFYVRDFCSSMRHSIEDWKHSRGLSKQAPQAENLAEVQAKIAALRRNIEEARLRARKSWRDYGYFNILDWLSISMGLALLNVFNISESMAVVTFAVLTLTVSLWNFRKNQALYRTHFAVLTLCRA